MKVNGVSMNFVQLARTWKSVLFQYILLAISLEKLNCKCYMVLLLYASLPACAAQMSADFLWKLHGFDANAILSIHCNQSYVSDALPRGTFSITTVFE